MSNNRLTGLPRFAALQGLPDGYQLATRLEIDSQRTLILLNVLGLVPLAIGGLFFFGIDRLLAAGNYQPSFDLAVLNDSPMLLAFLLVVLVFVMLSFHELCHGLA